MAEEPREFPRYATEASLVVRIGDTETRGRCQNISGGGVCTELEDTVPLGSNGVLELTLVFNEDAFSEPLLLPARAVWSTPLSDCHQVGFQLLALSSEQRSFLSLFLRYLEEGRAAQEQQKSVPPPFKPPDSDPFA